MRGRRWTTLIILAVVTVVVAVVTAAIVVGVGSTTPSGAVTVPDDVLMQYVSYVEHKYPKEGRAEPGVCFSRRHKPNTYKSFPIFGCTASQMNSTGVQMRLECVVSTTDGIRTPSDGAAGWPLACLGLNHKR